MTLATRIGVMNRGKIVQTVSPREIYEGACQPLRRRLRRFGEPVRRSRYRTGERYRYARCGGRSGAA
jgi:ABC-type glutathione transport system ATPase component